MKHISVSLPRSRRLSHPEWVRGLKHHVPLYVQPLTGSHPEWVRGLKQCFAVSENEAICVAPRVGAWIETSSSTLVAYRRPVAPRVGAWIETTIPWSLTDMALSHPEWVRGLKLPATSRRLPSAPSPPEWVRGLKQVAGRSIPQQHRRTPSGCVD